MYDFILAIPEAFGWVMVGALAMLDLIIGGIVGTVIYNSIKAKIAAKREERAEAQKINIKIGF